MFEGVPLGGEGGGEVDSGYCISNPRQKAIYLRVRWNSIPPMSPNVSSIN